MENPREDISSAFIGFLAGLLLISGLGLVTGNGYKALAGTNNNSGNGNNKAKSQWKFDQVQCSVALSVHGNLNLGKQTLDPGEFLFWDATTFNEASRTVKTESDCPSGYVLSVHVSNYQPNSVNVLEDFALKATEGSTYAQPSQVSVSLPQTWNYFSGTGLNNSLEIGKVGESDKHGNMTGNNIDGTSWIMEYRYKMDVDDLPNREYFVEMTYTVSVD